MATKDASAVDTTNATIVNTFDPSKPFNPKSVPYKHITFTAAAKKRNRLIIQKNFEFEEECTICLASMLNKSVIYTPCKHRYHSTCIFAMMAGPHQSRHKCPLCRFDMSTAIMKLHDDDVRVVLLMTFLIPVSQRSEVVGNEVVTNEVVTNEVVTNEVVTNEVVSNEPISLFDEETEVDDDEASADIFDFYEVD